MRIAVDAMGGDYAPQAIVEGTVQAAKKQPGELELVLVGREQEIRSELLRLNAVKLSKISIVNADQVIGMEEDPAQAVHKKKDCSIMKAASLLKEGEVQAVITAGNTGAAVVSMRVKCRAMPGVERPAIAVVMPALHGPFLLLDAGATPDCKPHYLLQFAVMGDVYARYILGIQRPKVGLLSLGEEESKGTDLTRNTYKLLQNAELNFIGNIEGNDLFTDKVDVVVCDGFVGNVVLKVCESFAGAFQRILKRELMKNLLSKAGAFLMKGAFRNISKKMHYSEYGGASLLGINGNCIISHGRSSSEAVKNAIGATRYLLQKDLNKHIIDAITSIG